MARSTLTSTKLIWPVWSYGTAIGKAKPGLDRLDIDLVTGLLRSQKFALADRKRHIHRILADDDGERAAFGTDDIALGDVGLADLAGNRGADFGIAKIDFGGLEVGLVAQDLPLCLLVRGKRLISRDCVPALFVSRSSARVSCASVRTFEALLRVKAPSACSTAAWNSPFSMR